MDPKKIEKKIEQQLREMGGMKLEPLPDGSCPLCKMLGIEEESDEEGEFRVILDILDEGKA